MQSPQWRTIGASVSDTDRIKIGWSKLGLESRCDGMWSRLAAGEAACVGDMRYSLLCVHWAQCKGALSRAGNARPRSPTAPTWTLTCARTQASGRISATRASSASRRSPASIFISGRTQVGLSRGPDWPPARPQPLSTHALPLLQIARAPGGSPTLTAGDANQINIWSGVSGVRRPVRAAISVVRGRVASSVPQPLL